jgi:hypothetical protein
LPSDSASGFRKKREAVIGLTPASLATSVSLTLPCLVRFRAIDRSYHRQFDEQSFIDSATNALLNRTIAKTV